MTNSSLRCVNLCSVLPDYYAMRVFALLLLPDISDKLSDSKKNMTIITRITKAKYMKKRRVRVGSAQWA